MTLQEFLNTWHDDSTRLLVHTSGSTGKPKPMMVEKARMMASARMTCAFLGLKAGDRALLCMPLDYIAGKMMVVRALTWGLQLVETPPSGHPLADENLPPVDFAAMVPMQVYNSLQVENECLRLKNIRHLLIGGGAVNEHLASQLRDFKGAVWSTYGMTETLSHIALRRLSGPDASEWYTPLDGVALATNEDNCLVIKAPAVAENLVKTNDIVEMNPDGRRFKVVGRKDNVICCGGLKIQAEKVEKMLQPHWQHPFYITKQKDEKFGEIPVLVTEEGDKKLLEDILKDILPKYWLPKKIVFVGKLPLTETGKPKRTFLP